jgi:hypothetical protein
MAAKKWTEEELKALGTMPDRDLARRFERSRQAIVVKRALLGIPVFVEPGERRGWTEEEDKLLGTFGFPIGKRARRDLSPECHW